MNRGMVLHMYPNKYQEAFFNNQFGCCRFVYNHFLDEIKDHYKVTGKYLSYNQCSKHLTALKQDKTLLKEADSISLQQALRILDNSMSRFFDKQTISTL